MNDWFQKGIGKDINREGLEIFFQEAKQRRYAFIGYEEARGGGTPRFVIMRHDVDVDLHYAQMLAELEAHHGVHATFFVMLRNPLYNLLAPQSSKCLQRIIALGHQIGLHFDVSAYPELGEAELLEAIRLELSTLKKLAGVSSVSQCITFHKPSQRILNAEITTDEFFSGYNRSFFRDIRYIADSAGNWREESILDLIRSERSPKIQFTSHPVWWIAPGRTQAEKLAAFLKHRAENADEELAATVNDPTRNFILHVPASKSEPRGEI